MRSSKIEVWIQEVLMFWSCGSSTLKSNLLQVLDQSPKEVAKSWTFEVQLIQKYLTNPEVSCLKSALKWSNPELQWKNLAKPEVKHELSAFSHRSQKPEITWRSPQRSSQPFILKLKSSSLWGSSKYKIHWKCEVITPHKSTYLALEKSVVEAEVSRLRVVSALPWSQVV